jgi:hypothetical protein
MGLLSSLKKPKVFTNGSPSGKVYVGIDQSYSGFAMTALDENDKHYTEVVSLDGAGVERLANARGVIYEFLDGLDVAAVAIEGYAFGSQMANMAGELGGIVRLSLWDRYSNSNINAKYPLVVAPTGLKKYATGKGNGVSKSQIMLAVYKKWGTEFLDDNAADSYVLARIARNKHDFEYEKEVYDKLTLPGK